MFVFISIYLLVTAAHLSIPSADIFSLLRAPKGFLAYSRIILLRSSDKYCSGLIAAFVLFEEYHSKGQSQPASATLRNIFEKDL
ncbi:hypothetical protein KSZ02_24430, partial [Bacteroides thetaiotaomicron]|uniref:hypothetical protein n=1 Tax=Bacteroides thetaiotaomicron TaxID=818 RepID=UPI001C37DA23